MDKFVKIFSLVNYTQYLRKKQFQLDIENPRVDQFPFYNLDFKVLNEYYIKNDGQNKQNVVTSHQSHK